MAKSKGWQPLAPDEQQEIIKRYVAGETLTVLTEEYRRGKPALRKILTEAGVTLRPRGYPKGTAWTVEHREAHRKATGTPEFAEKSRRELLKRLPTMRGPATNTAIERRMHDALMNAGIGFTTQSLLLDRYLVDIEVHQAPIVIEADGSQHALRIQQAKDTARDAALVTAGYQVFRFTGSEINTDAAACVQRVIDACGLVPDEVPVYEVRTSFTGPLHPRWKGGKQEFTCEGCGTVFLAQPAHRKGPHIYCGRDCANRARRGKQLSAEHRAAIGAGVTGKERKLPPPFTAEHRANLSAALKGKPKSAEHVAKVAAANMGKHGNASQIKIESDLTRNREKPAEMTGSATLF
jgi:very-short-patch-repair endonuclease